ncbi:MAG: 5-oxoprolinase subunit PxpB, partial [Aliidongia sp.]
MTRHGTTPRFLAAGDTALIVEFGTTVEPALIAAVQALDRAVAAAGIPGVIETVPSFRSLMVHYDPLTTSAEALAETISALEDTDAAPATAGRSWLLPCCYAAAFGPDLDHVAAATGLTTCDVIEAHSATAFTVAMLGFLPGCPFLSGLDPRFDLPRRTEPRTRLAGGSVAVAQALSVIYPTESPGGWHLIGNCPLPLFDPGRSPPALLAPGDAVRFRPIDAAEHAQIRTARDYDLRRECLQ